MNIQYHPNFQLGACCDTSKVYNPFKIMKVTSKVVDFNTGLPIENVNVYLKNKPTIGTITNVNGEFTIEATVDEPLIFSHVTYGTIELLAKEVQNIEYLEETANQLEEVNLGILPKMQTASFSIWAIIILAGLYLGTKKKQTSTKATV